MKKQIKILKSKNYQMYSIKMIWYTIELNCTKE